jgi:hypothetical protein
MSALGALNGQRFELERRHYRVCKRNSTIPDHFFAMGGEQEFRSYRMGGCDTPCRLFSAAHFDPNRIWFQDISLHCGCFGPLPAASQILQLLNSCNSALSPISICCRESLAPEKRLPTAKRRNIRGLFYRDFLAKKTFHGAPVGEMDHSDRQRRRNRF